MHFYHRLPPFLLLASMLFAACDIATPVSTRAPASAPVVQPSQTSSSAAVVTAVVTNQPSPTVSKAAVIFLAPEGSDPELAGVLKPLLADLSGKAGLSMEVRSSISEEDLADGVKIVVAIPPDAGLSGLVPSAPGTQFLAINIPGLSAAPNLTVIGDSAASPDQAAFLAGYIAALVSPDWRAAVISQADSVSGKAVNLGFTHGVDYFCGLCRPAYPPFPDRGYPLSAELPSGAGEADWQNTLAYLKTWEVKTVYVDPAVSSDGLIKTLAGAGFNLIGAGPAPAEIQQQWVASIGSGDPLQEIRDIWPELMNGKNGSNPGSSLAISEVNEELFSPGKQRLANEMLDKLKAGFIDTGVDPATGESR